MRTPRRLVATLLAATLGWTSLTLLVVAAPAEAQQGQHGTKKRDAPHDPATYYAGTEGLTGTALALKLNEIIDGNTFVPYTDNSSASAPDVWKALKVLDRNPNNPSMMVDFYSGDDLDPANQCGGSCALNGWNREHTWAQSRGSFNTNPGPGTDLFHMRPLRGNTNSSRGNKDFDIGGTATVPGCSACKADGDSFEPFTNKGDLARGLFYMDVRYNGDADDGYGLDLKLWDQTGNSGSQIGKLSTLIAWSQADPPDDAERLRNNTIDGDYQHNRNPFIDHPEWVCAIWGSSNPTACSNTNAAPSITSPTTKSTPRNIPFSLPLTATDANSDPLTWSLVSPAAAHGSASITGSAPNFSLSYTPATDYAGPDAVGVQVSDGKGGVASATIQITVTATNQTPTVQDIGSDEPLPVPKLNSKQITLLGNDADGDALTYSIVNQPTLGTVTINGNVATYTTNRSTGIDGFTYRATDTSNAQSPTGQVTVTIGNSPNAPTATPVSATVDEDTADFVTLIGDDPDIATGETLKYALTSQPAKGTVSLTGNQVSYTPNPNANGADSFNWSVTDGTTTKTSTASITITAVNDVPVANAQSVTTAEDTAKAITLTGSDPDGDTLTFAIVDQPAHGSVSLNNATATYTPTGNYHGPDSFTFKASDASASSPKATVSITVTPVNDAPTATAITGITTPEDTAKQITLNGNDIDGDTLTYGVGSQPAHGSVAVVGDKATYTPAENYNGPDSFNWTVSDGTVTISRSASITVTPVNDPPTAAAKSKSGPEDTDVVVTLTGSDVDNDVLSFAIVDAPAHGDVALVGDQATYTPDPNFHGDDSFTYTASDASETSAKATVSITVTSVNDPPTVDDETLNVTAGGSLSQSLTVSDPDGDTVTITSATTPAHGTVEFAGTMVTYTPSVRSGTDAFTVTVSDGHGGTDTAQVDVTIAARTATVSLSTPLPTRAKPVTTTITVTDTEGPKPGGQVTLKNGATTLGTATLNASGVATVTWTPTSAGVASLVASYAGDDVFEPATSPTTPVPVAKSASTFTFGGKVKKGKKSTVKVTIAKIGSAAPTGTVTLKVGKKSFTATLVGGVATFKIGKAPAKSKLKVSATYGGDSQYLGGTAKNTYKLK